MRIRLAHLSDSHFDERNRIEDCVAVHAAFLEQAREAEVDLILHAGDFFERKSSPAERNALADFLVGAAEIAPVIGVRGNHDAEGDLDLFPLLHSTHPIYIRALPSIGESDCIRIGGAVVLTLPWFSKANLVSQLPPDLSGDETTARTIEAAGQLLTILRSNVANIRAQDFTPLLVGHVQVAGSEVSTGQTLIGQTVELAPGDLQDLGCAYVALGHIHKRQGWGNVWYSGSPNRCNFGEPEAKGWNLVTIENGDLVDVEFRQLPARRIVLIERDWSQVDRTDDLGAPEHAVVPDGEDVAGALVRVRYRIQPEHLHLVDEEAICDALQEAGAVEVKIEAVLEHQARVRSEAITKAADTWEKLRAYWQAAAIDVPEAAQARIRAKLDEIESRQRQEVADAAA